MEIISKIEDLQQLLIDKACPIAIREDMIAGIAANAMALQLTKNIVDVIDWKNVATDPVRMQFLPLASELEEDHPNLALDSLSEKKDEVVAGVIHRYPNKVLFLLNKVCPAYCSFCTRSYLVGPSTQRVQKDKIKMPFKRRVKGLLEYLKCHPNINDVLISGGDLVLAKLPLLEDLLTELGQLTTIKSIRLGTRGLFFLPQYFFKDHPFHQLLAQQYLWLKKRGIEFSIQSHFNHANELNSLSQMAANELTSLGIKIRNQTVLLRGVNADLPSLQALIAALVAANIIPYYIYQMDMVPHAEHFRTSLQETITLSKQLEGCFTGFHTPKFVVDLPNGGGKTNIYAFEKYEKETGTYHYKSAVKANGPFKYYDPLRISRMET